MPDPNTCFFAFFSAYSPPIQGHREHDMRMTFIVLLLGIAGLTDPTPSAAEIALEPCRIDAGTALGTAEADCGTLSVPENPDEPAGRQIDLSIAVVPALSVNPAPDPLVILAGGPGQSAIDAYLMMQPAFEGIRQKRPILLVDQRGTGRSNLMTCPTPDEALAAEYDLEYGRELVRECLQSLDGDPALYTTSLAVRDLDRVRAELGYQEVNLWGGSYGTRVALHYLRRFPEHTRSVIIDGVAPADELLGPMLANDAQSSLDQLADRCSETPECADTFGDVAAAVVTLKQKLDSEPVDFAAVHPRTGEQIDVPLTDDTLAGVLRLSIYSPTTRAILPLLVAQALEEDYRLLASQALLITESMDGAMAIGMHNSVVCAEDMPFYNDTDRPDGIDDTFMGSVALDYMGMVCEEWPAGPIDDDFHEPVTSDKPVLILSGEFDPVTPPENGARTAETLSNSKHIIAPQQGHIVSGLGCVPKLTAGFVASASVADLDDSCVDRLGGMPFFVSPLGPTP
ncbi:MAG: alpha/beta hydrolase [Pseudomonadota bacterium]